VKRKGRKDSEKAVAIADDDTKSFGAIHQEKRKKEINLNLSVAHGSWEALLFGKTGE